MLDLDEAGSRWARARAMMRARDLDVLIAIDVSRDEILLGHQRWLTGYVPIGGPAAVLLFRDGAVELVSERIGKPVAEHCRAQGLPIDLVNGFSPCLIAERVARHGALRVGVAEPAAFAWEVAAALSACTPAPALVDASAEMLGLRLRKSPGELEWVRRSCAIADAVWAEVPALFRLGRRHAEIVADVDHLARLHGAESGFHLLLPLPFLGRSTRVLADADRVVPDTRYLLEVSPRLQGYYSQLTIPVTTRVNDVAALRAYEDVVAAKLAAQPRMVPGADLSEVARFVAAFLAERGRTMVSLSLGHFCGLALEEPRHDPRQPFLLEAGMTLIFHPVLSDPAWHSLMRADTYLITTNGAERLNRHEGGMLAVA